MMRYFSICFILFFCSVVTNASTQWSYYFNKPASIWEESVPLGNGRIGIMPWGGIDKERIVLNEISLWAGSKQDADNPDAYKYLSEIRNLLFSGKNKEAQQLMYKTFTCKGRGGEDKGAFGNYQNLGNLSIDFIYPDSSAQVKDYKRILDISNAISTTTYAKGGITYKREYFTSFADDIAVIRLTASQSKSLSMNISMFRDENFHTYTTDNTLYISGQMEATIKEQGMRYIGEAKIINKGGALITHPN